MTAAHDAATAAARITVAAIGAHTSRLASSQSAKKIAIPTTSVPNARARSVLSRARQTALPISCATAKNPSVTRPAIATAYATMANGMSRMPISVSASAMQSTTSPGRIRQLSGESDPECARESELDGLDDLPKVWTGEEQHADGDHQQDAEASDDHLGGGDRAFRRARGLRGRRRRVEQGGE